MPGKLPGAHPTGLLACAAATRSAHAQQTGAEQDQRHWLRHFGCGFSQFHAQRRTGDEEIALAAGDGDRDFAGGVQDRQRSWHSV